MSLFLMFFKSQEEQFVDFGLKFQNFLKKHKLDIKTLENELSSLFISNEYKEEIKEKIQNIRLIQKTQKDFSNIYKSFKNSEDIQELIVRRKEIRIKTFPIKYQEYIWGEFLISLEFDKFSVINLKEIHQDGDKSIHHFFINRGHCCFGNCSSRIQQYWKKGEFDFLIFSIIALLNSPPSGEGYINSFERWKNLPFSTFCERSRINPYELPSFRLNDFPNIKKIIEKTNKRQNSEHQEATDREANERYFRDRLCNNGIDCYRTEYGTAATSAGTTTNNDNWISAY